MTSLRAAACLLVLVAVAGLRRRANPRARAPRTRRRRRACGCRASGRCAARRCARTSSPASARPGGVVDRIGLRRLAPCAGGGGSGGALPPGHAHERRDLRATAPTRTCGSTWRRPASAPGASTTGRTRCRPEASQDELQTLAGWTRERFLDDAEWATTFVRSTDPGPLYLVGFSFGASMAYGIASRGDQPVMGLVILDGVPGGGRRHRRGERRLAPSTSAASRLPYADRERLLRAVIKSPEQPVAGRAATRRPARRSPTSCTPRRRSGGRAA